MMLSLGNKYSKSVPLFRSSVIAVLSRSLPFVENKRATLIHRPRYAAIMEGSWQHHYAMEMHCGSVFTGSEKKLKFASSVPDGKMVCARCEKKATEQGNPSSSDICGKHVCIGGVQSYSICCGDKQ